MQSSLRGQHSRLDRFGDCSVSSSLWCSAARYSRWVNASDYVRKGNPLWAQTTDRWICLQRNEIVAFPAELFNGIGLRLVDRLQLHAISGLCLNFYCLMHTPNQQICTCSDRRLASLRQPKDRYVLSHYMYLFFNCSIYVMATSKSLCRK